MPIGTTPGEVSLETIVLGQGPFGSVLVQDIDSAVRYAVHLTNLNGDILTDAETAPGTYTVHRLRAGTDTEITAATAATEASGVISAVVDFSDGSWADADLGYIEFSGITATINEVTTELPVLRKSFRVTGAVGVAGATETNGPFTYTDAGGEQDVHESTAVTRRRVSIVLSNRNMTQTGTVRLFMKVDGINYDQYDSSTVTVGAPDNRAFDYQFVTNQNYKLTYQENADEGAARVIDFQVIEEALE